MPEGRWRFCPFSQNLRAQRVIRQSVHPQITCRDPHDSTGPDGHANARQPAKAHRDYTETITASRSFITSRSLSQYNQLENS